MVLSAEYVGKTSFFGDNTPLPIESGYAIVLGFGAFFSVVTTVLVYLDKYANGTEHTSEFFNTAGRSVKTGLTASVIVSQWTWAATLLQSSNVAWNYGVSGPFWYASGATIQVLLFGILAIEVKRRARTAHTVCEMVLARWGKGAHITFLCFALMANVIVTSMLLLGGAATVNALTGVDTNLASFLIPWGVILYTAAGGLKATFMASYLHTAIIFIVLVVCVYTVYVKNFSSDLIYTGLQTVAGYTEAQCQQIFSQGTSTFFEKGKYACGPVSENEGGSYLTMLSGGGTKFGIINIVGNFGTVFVDQSYWQSAIAAKPTSAHKGYLLGGLVWFTIPFALATSLGLCAVALQLPISSAEAGAGLVPPAVATHLFGSFGSVMMAVMLFMAITSTGSAEGIAVSSLVTYDIYKTYINPQCTGKQALLVSKVVVVVFGLLMGGLGVALNYMGLNLGWVYQFMGNAIGSAVVPLWNLLMWKKANATGAIVAAWGGMILALSTWLIVCQAEFGEITVDNLGTLNPNLAGNIVALASSALIHAAFSFMSPQNYDFESMGKIEMLEQDMSGLDEQDYTNEFLDAAKWWIQKWGWGFTIIMVLFWPLLSLPAGVFTQDYFAFWVFISIAWSFVATFVIIVLPIHEVRGFNRRVLDAGELEMHGAPASAQYPRLPSAAFPKAYENYGGGLPGGTVFSRMASPNLSPSPGISPVPPRCGGGGFCADAGWASSKLPVRFRLGGSFAGEEEDDLHEILKQVAQGHISLQTAVGLLEAPFGSDQGAARGALRPAVPAVPAELLDSPLTNGLCQAASFPSDQVALAVSTVSAHVDLPRKQTAIQRIDRQSKAALAHPAGSPPPVVTEGFEDLDPSCKGCGVRKMQLKVLAEQVVTLSESVMKLAGVTPSSQDRPVQEAGSQRKRWQKTFYEILI
eukprot:g18418.t1